VEIRTDTEGAPPNPYWLRYAAAFAAARGIGGVETSERGVTAQTVHKDAADG
jgi:hypothetical protein